MGGMFNLLCLDSRLSDMKCLIMTSNVFVQVLFAGSLLKNNKAVHEALMAEMSKKATVLDCIKAIEMS